MTYLQKSEEIPKAGNVEVEGKVDGKVKIEDEVEEKTTEFYLNQGILNMESGKDEEANEDFSNAVRLDPQNEKAYAMRAGLYAASGKFLRSMKDYDKAITLNSNNAESYYNRGNLKFGSGKFPEAVEDYLKAVEINSSNPNYYANLLELVIILDERKTWNKHFKVFRKLNLNSYQKGLLKYFESVASVAFTENNIYVEKVIKKINKEFKNYDDKISWAFDEVKKWIKKDKTLSSAQKDAIKDLTLNMEYIIEDHNNAI